MHKSNFYYSQCVEAASKSTMNFHLGAVLVKGGKVISSGHNHCRTHYDGKDVREQGHRKPASMHAEMHAIHSLTGMSPSGLPVPSTESRVLDRVDNDLNLNATAKDGRGSVFYRGTSHARRFRSDKKRGSASKVGQTFSFGQRASQAGSDTHQGAGLDKSWGARRRDSRVNGADLHVGVVCVGVRCRA
ncbi:hypothetical protein BKA83DRAFT_4307404 [Pisolithus microcarpus]|nr:hypothetical protein BKA83DRAFT_4307404 [Pisolithus microcarpus]